MQKLVQQGAQVIAAKDVEDAARLIRLHRQKLGLIIVHREMDGAPLDMLKMVRKDRELAKIPILVSSSEWTDADFLSHQSSPSGVHGYLHFPCGEADFFACIQSTVGTLSKIPPPPPIVLEDPRTFASFRVSSGNIRLEMPAGTRGDFSHAVPPPPPGRGSLEEAVSIPESAPEVTPEYSVESFAAPALPEVSPPPEEVPSLPKEVLLSLETSLDALPPPPQEDLVMHFGAESSLSIDTPPPTTDGLSLGMLPSAMDGLPFSMPESPQERTLLLDVAPKEEEMMPPPPMVPQSDFMISPSHILGDAVIPGGAVQAPDIETLKRYLMLREQDVVALSQQLRTAQMHVQSLQETIQKEKEKSRDLQYRVGEQKSMIDDFDKNLELLKADHQFELQQLHVEMKTKGGKARAIEMQCKDLTEELERVRDRVRLDIRKIRVRERELENKLELAKKDQEALVGARESKIMDLKRKLDSAEFNIDLIQEQFAKEKANSEALRQRMVRLSQVVKAVDGALDGNEELLTGT